MLWVEVSCRHCGVVVAAEACCSKVLEPRLVSWAHSNVGMRRPGSAHIGMRPVGRIDVAVARCSKVEIEAEERSNRAE